MSEPLKLRQDISDETKEKATSDFYYDLFVGGYIDPYDYLDKESADKVTDALQIVELFRDLLEDNELIGEM